MKTMTKKSVTNLSMVVSVLAVTAAVVLPQMCHLLGDWLGFQTALGEILLPMHLPVMLAGILGGPVAGLVTGLASPVISFALTAMPRALLLPYMMVELAVYGLTAGLLRGSRIPVVGQVLLTQVSGRAARAVALLVAAYGLGLSTPPIAIIWTSILLGATGILLQLVWIPLLMRRQNR